VNSLPKTVARQHRGCDLNPCPTAAESSTLTTRLLSQRAAMRVKIATAASAAGVRHGLLELLMRSRDWRSVKWGHWDTAAAIARYAHYVRYGTVECGSIYPVSRTSAPDRCITDQRYFSYESHFSFSFCYTHTHTFNGHLSGITRVCRYQEGKTNLDFTEARDSEWQWHQLGHMQVCTSLQTGNHASTPPLSFLQAACPSCRPTNSIKALMASSFC